MLRKLRAASDMLRTAGAGAILREARIRFARTVRGTNIGDHFPRFACYRHADGDAIPLYAGYREYLKPLHVLSHADAGGVDRYVRDNQQSHMDVSGFGGASGFVHLLQRELGIELVGKRVLDVGCGDGALVFALAAIGADEAHGIELERPTPGWDPQHQASLIGRIARSGSAIRGTDEIQARARLYVMDIQRPNTDERFDLIVSNSVVEHIVDLAAGLEAMRRMLKPAGTMVHLFNPFFSENGGHEWCILDFPWGHVRLTRAEFAEYLATYRAWEAEAAMRSFDGSFNNPKLTLDEIDHLATRLGLQCMQASERRSVWWKPDAPSDRILAQCRRSYPRVTWRDLTAESVLRVWSAR